MIRATAEKPQPKRPVSQGTKSPASKLGLDDAGFDETLRCPKCGRPLAALRCGHCGSQLPASCLLEDPGLLARAVGKRLSQLESGEGRGLATPTSEAVAGGLPTDGDQAKTDDLQDTQTPPSLCLWIYERLADAGIHPTTILDPCWGIGNLTRPFEKARVIWFEVKQGRDFFKYRKPIVCDLVLCNPPWGDGEQWLMHIVKRVGNKTPIVYVCPLGCFAYKAAPYRQYLESSGAPRLDAFTPLPNDTFVGVHREACILWLNLPTVRNVALVPSRCLVRKNTLEEAALL